MSASSARRAPESSSRHRWTRAISDVLGELRAIRSLLEQQRDGTRLRLEDCGEIVTLHELARLVGRSPRYFERTATLEKQTGVRILPEPIDGMPRRYRKADVEAWLKRGVWKVADARVRHARSLRAVATGDNSNQTRKGRKSDVAQAV
jgi:hypothetical protein